MRGGGRGHSDGTTKAWASWGQRIEGPGLSDVSPCLGRLQNAVLAARTRQGSRPAQAQRQTRRIVMPLIRGVCHRDQGLGGGQEGHCMAHVRAVLCIRGTQAVKSPVSAAVPRSDGAAEGTFTWVPAMDSGGGRRDPAQLLQGAWQPEQPGPSLLQPFHFMGPDPNTVGKKSRKDRTMRLSTEALFRIAQKLNSHLR